MQIAKWISFSWILTPAKLYGDLVGAVLSACIADSIGVRALATRPDVIGVEPGDVRHSGNQHAVAINVDIVRGSSIPGKVHPLVPLHLVAACDERDLPRCRAKLRAISAAGIQFSKEGATPNDHFAPSPNCRV